MAIEIPLPDLIELRMAVAFDAGPDASDVPDDDALLGQVDAWLVHHAPERIADGIRSFLARGLTRIFVEPIADVPLPPPDLLQMMGLDDDDLARLSACTHAVVILGGDLPQPPRMGLWTMHAVASALAMSLDGLVIDPDQQRVIPATALLRPLPEDGRVAVADHIIIPVSEAEPGVAWMTTLGMGRFGLPNLEVRDVPLHLTEAMNGLLNGIAQSLVETVMMHHASRPANGGQPGDAEQPDNPAADSWDGIDVLRLDEPFELTAAAVLRAHAARPEPGAETPDGRARIGLGFTDAGQQLEPFIRVHPPAGADADMGLWINDLLEAIYGEAAPDLRLIDGQSEALQRARERAIAELPAVRQRFDDGLPPRTGLYVKVGFETPDGFSEFMWLAVENWTGRQLRTRLANDPVHRTDLRAGEPLDVSETDIADWLISHPDGTFEGGYTNRVLMEEGEA